MTLPTQQPTPSTALSREARFLSVRQVTEDLCSPLETDDFGVQPTPEVSPPKWHLAHTTWFFEKFLLLPHLKKYTPFHPVYDYLFNSYYETVGAHFERARRGVLSRPTVDEVYSYRWHVNAAVLELLERVPADRSQEIRALLALGISHEEQHQELLLTDIKQIYWHNPLRPTYKASPPRSARGVPTALGETWFPRGVREIGHAGEGFAYDNERPRHRVYLGGFWLRKSPVLNGEFLEFIEDDGYQNPRWWLSDGWDTVKREHWTAPLYWERHGSEWHIFTLGGLKRLDPLEPVCHVSLFEADAFARWRGARLPTEAEWELAASEQPIQGSFLESRILHPQAPERGEHDTPVGSLGGNVWEWTASAYRPYPGFRALPSALGEYNGKFMCNQFVLRGGSVATPRAHFRTSYRNFFPPEARWQFSGFRLAREDDE
jgi:ergothioneine biosynthesis protein EgtB